MCKNLFSFSITQLLLVPVFALASFSSNGQNVSIVGETNKPDALVRLLCSDELLSGAQYVVAETFTDSNGAFSLNAEITEVREAQIAVGLERLGVVLSPGSNYDITISLPTNNGVPYFEREQPSITINNADDGGLYATLMMAETTVNAFFYRCFDKFYRSRNISYLDTLQNDIDKYVGEVKFKYVEDFLKYRKAAAMMVVGEKKAIANYFDNQEVLYNQPSYIDVFSELFSGYFNNRSFNPQEFKKAFYSGYDAFAGYLKNDEFLMRNPRLCEVVTVYELKRLYHENQYDKKTVVDYLEIIGERSEFKENRVLALNMSHKLTELAWDSEAPSFNLRDKEGNVVSLMDFGGKMVLLQFVDNLTDAVTQDLSYLKELCLQWRDNVAVVTIATPEIFDEMSEYFDENKFDWTLLNVGNDILLFERYRVRITPTYIILKPNGRVGMAPAPSPENNLEFHVRRIHKYL
ncbi:MAG: peroxiredoxin family protein [Candidatus Limimorpha sp.]